ncbi:hypothetical protein [Asticcacaulis taihuensis]|uniref:hypothetical protein n=1 Tax=Asticcacaulis taihuensis TaxID=260084 RepID=UPI003F7CC70E
MQSPSNAADLNRSLRFQVFQGKPFFELTANRPLTMCVTEQNRIFSASRLKLFVASEIYHSDLMDNFLPP